MSVRDASEPVAGLALALDLVPAVRGATIAPSSVHIGACIARIAQCAHRRRGGQWPEDRGLAVVTARGEQQALLAKRLDRLACRAHARERLEKVGNRLADLGVGIEHDTTGLVIHEAGGQDAMVLAPSHLV